MVCRIVQVFFVAGMMTQFLFVITVWLAAVYVLLFRYKKKRDFPKWLFGTFVPFAYFIDGAANTMWAEDDALGARLVRIGSLVRRVAGIGLVVCVLAGVPFVLCAAD